MAGVKISNLPAIPSAALTDLIPEVQPAVGGTTYKATLQQVYNLFNLSAGSVSAGLINQLAYYAATGNAVSGLATAANGTLITSAGSVPSISSTLPTAVQANITRLGAQAIALNMNTHLINNVVDPVADQDAATKKYVDDTSQGRQFKDPVEAATTAALTVTYANGAAGVGATLTNAGAQAAFAIDGYTAALNDRILVKDQASTFQNGIYTVTTVGTGATNWVLTRSTDMDTPSQFQFATTLVINGTLNSGRTYTETLAVATIGTDPVVWVQTGDASGVTSISAADTTVTLTPNPIVSTGTIAVNTATFVRAVKTQVFLASATYTPSTGMIYCIVEIVGGGGGGGGCDGSAGQSGAGGGGAGAGYARKFYTAALLGANAAIVIGAAGAGGAAGNNNGTAGGNSTFTPAGAGAILTANGGGPGIGSAKTATSNQVLGGTQGQATLGDINIAGGHGQYGQVINGANGILNGGSGGNSFFSPVTQLRGAVNGAEDADGYGAGGSGGVISGGTGGGGNGSPGIVVITEFCNQ